MCVGVTGMLVSPALPIRGTDGYTEGHSKSLMGLGVDTLGKRWYTVFIGGEDRETTVPLSSEDTLRP